MKIQTDEDKTKSLADNFSDFEPGPGPVGMNPPPGAHFQSPPEPALEDSLCVQGPCKHYWHMKTSFPHGNPAGTFKPGEEPKKLWHTCLANPGYETDLAGTAVYECNRYAPSYPKELAELENRRKDYLRRQEKESSK